jgi:hypothetical protein
MLRLSCVVNLKLRECRITALDSFIVPENIISEGQSLFAWQYVSYNIIYPFKNDCLPSKLVGLAKVYYNVVPITS